MSTTFSVARRFVCVPILLVAAVALWLSTSPASHATTATQTQSLQATVPSGVTWGTAAGCGQSIAATDFGSVAGGSTAEKGPFTGCVTTTTPLSVSVASVALMTNAANNQIPASDLAIAPSTVPANAKAGCTSPCNLTNEQTLFTASPAGTSQFVYSLRLTLPASQAAGTYTGGLLQFTATA
ncbi:MAG: hypothetical protein JWN10_597 [Solirubrobacterales bacterium]|nr:hypothetical protein [Solirubrobacterales bacterium]